MYIKTEDVQKKCSKILSALDSNQLSNITECLEIEVVDNQLFFNITNREYYIKFNVPGTFENNFNCLIEARSFLKLISYTTKE